MKIPQQIEPSNKIDWVLYFLKLGAIGFGGPIALIGYMQEHLVEKKRWVTLQDYIQGIAFSELSPGPLATKLAMYLGWIRFGTLGATMIGIAFVLPSFLIIIPISILYIHFGDIESVRGVFYGVGAAIIAIILKSAFKIAKITIAKEKILWLIFVINGGMTLWNTSFTIYLFIASGLLMCMINSPSKLNNFHTHVLIPWPYLFLSGISGIPKLALFIKIALYFAWAGTFIFGSGLAIIPFLHSGVVEEYHWLTERQFLDAIAIAIATPGPATITVAFIGYLVGGFVGALLAAMGIFLPSYLFVVLLAPFYHRYASKPAVKNFIKGATSAAAGAIAGAALLLSKGSIVDLPTLAIFLVTLLIITTTQKIPDIFLIIIAGLTGFLIKF